MSLSRIIATLLLATFSLHAAVDETPKAQLSASIDQVLAAVADKSLDGNARRTLIRSQTEKRFAMPQMAALVLGNHWKDLAKEQQDAFVELFTETLLDSYLRKIETYNGETVRYDNVAADGGKAQIETTLAGSDKSIPIVYKLFRSGDEWKIYDVIIDGVSLVKTYRTQYGDYLNANSFADLTRTMKEKLAVK